MLLGRDIELTETTSEMQNNAQLLKMMILYGIKELGSVFLLALRTSKSIWDH
jgi:hypothetical protein